MVELGNICVSCIPNIETIYDVNFKIEPNEHAVARIKAMFANENININEKTIISIIDLHTGKKLFCGYVSKIYDNNKDNRLEKTIELISCSIDFDLKAYKRSFQNSSDSYESIYNKIADGVDGGSVLCGTECSESIGREIYQYEETNWKLIKRLAGNLKTSIYPDVSSEFPRINIGTTNKSTSNINDYLEYSEGASDRYFNIGAYVYGEDISLYRYFRVKTYENLEIGSLVKFKNVYNKVISKKAYSKKSEVIFEYILGQTDLSIQKSFINLKACGAVLKGTVSSVGAENLKVSLDIDKRYGSSAFCDYPYQSITSNMLYCMPEKDTSVYLNLNDAEGSEARVISCSRTNGNQCGDTKNSENKMFMVPSGIEFKMNNKNISLISSEDVENKWDLNISDGNFIKFNTAAPFNLRSNYGNFDILTNSTNINSPFVINFTGSDGFGGNIKISGTVEISGNKVGVKAEGRIEFKPINDAPKEIKITGKSLFKLLLKVLLTVVVVAVACVAAVLLAPVVLTTTAVIAISASVVGICAAGGAAYAGVLLYDQIKSDKKNGIKRSIGEYLYMGLDKFCTGAILTAPAAATAGLSIPMQLLGIGSTAISSGIYQGADAKLDEKLGGDFYDADSSFFETMWMDVKCAALGLGIGKVLGFALKGVFAGISKKLPYLEAMNRTAARQYIRKAYGQELMSLWKEFLEQNAGKRETYQLIKEFILSDPFNTFIASLYPDKRYNITTFNPNDYKAMGEKTYFKFEGDNLILVPSN